MGFLVRLDPHNGYQEAMPRLSIALFLFLFATPLALAQNGPAAFDPLGMDPPDPDPCL